MPARPEPARSSASSFEALLPHVVESVGDARRLLRDDLDAHGIAAPVVSDAQVVISELVANALVHARPTTGGGVVVSWRIDADVVVVRVTDGGGTGVPAESAATYSDTGGRGLGIVRALSSSWGLDTGPVEGVTVYAVIPLPTARLGQPSP